MVFISGVYASLAAFVIIFLALRVSKFRRLHRVGVGYGGQRDLEIAIRCHANALENIPMAIILLFIAESQGLGALWVHLAGVILVGSRVLHPWGLTAAQGGVHVGRVCGMLGSWLTIIGLAIFNIIAYGLASG